MALNSYTKPVLLFESIIDSTKLLSSSLVDNEQYLHDGITTTFATFEVGGSLKYDLGAVTSFNSVAISRNTMSDATGSLFVSGSNDDISYTSLAVITPEGNRTSFKTFTANYRYIQIAATGSTAFNIANIYIGTRIEIPTGMPVGFAPPKYNSMDRLNPNKTITGNLAGITVLRGGYDSDIQLKMLNPNWVKTYGETIINAVRKGPFFFCWDLISYPDDVMFCWAKDSLPRFSYSDPFLMESSIQVNGVI